MNVCACGVRVVGSLCAFERRTLALIRSRRCVACLEPVFDDDVARVEGRCGNCRERRVRLSAATRRLLKRESNARHMRAVRAA